MIGLLSNTSFLVAAFLIVSSCSRVENEEQEILPSTDSKTNEVDSLIVNSPSRADYLTEDLGSEVDLIFEDSKNRKGVIVVCDGESCVLKKYEGRLIGASGDSEGYLLSFEPYSYWDDDMEQMVDSPHKEKIKIRFSKAQNDLLNIIDFTDATHNIAWDYYENLFLINYFEKSNGDYIPIKLLNQGKTEWDG